MNNLLSAYAPQDMDSSFRAGKFVHNFNYLYVSGQRIERSKLYSLHVMNGMGKDANRWRDGHDTKKIK